jgi:RNA polymerase sigma-70 factor (ECF subfamily)
MTPKQEKERQAILTVAHHAYEKGLNNLHAFFKLSDRVISRDLVQDTFIKTWKYLVRGGKIEVMKAFLYHVLNNLIIDQYRKKKRRVSLIERGLEPGADETDKLFDILDGKTAMLLIKFLPERYQKVMHMKYIQELSLQEMSLITGRTKNALAVQIHRGLQKLKLLYKHT